MKISLRKLSLPFFIITTFLYAIIYSFFAVSAITNSEDVQAQVACQNWGSYDDSSGWCQDGLGCRNRFCNDDGTWR
ncbi:hypothetical protein KC717_06900, partial [Candidatus Dojkabacteria bacterium]|nr:hypothetical protein [Candidatus Dojkabacteria bacterium]